MPRARKTQSNLTASTIHRLNTYALAAGAAGVSLLALAQPSEAEVIYTPAHATVGRDGSYKLDLTNNGKVDFTIAELTGGRGGIETFESLLVIPAKGNAVKCRVCTFTSVYSAAALNAGSQIGGGRNISFFNYAEVMALRIDSRGNTFSLGQWLNVRDRYLGLKFHLSDGAHFGWARLSVEYLGGSQRPPTWRAQITGYAYESTPDTPIKAGQINGEDDAAVPASAQPIALGALALGSSGLALWRREETETKSKS
jgi:hypothetical protein